MIVSLEWLKDYTDVNVSPEEFCDRMIMSGSNLETMEKAGEDMQKVVVGKIVKIEKHPDADKLVVCQLDVGQEDLLQIVTGAPNVLRGPMFPWLFTAAEYPVLFTDSLSRKAEPRSPRANSAASYQTVCSAPSENWVLMTRSYL